jgi:hypothetical protein
VSSASANQATSPDTESDTAGPIGLKISFALFGMRGVKLLHNALIDEFRSSEAAPTRRRSRAPDFHSKRTGRANVGSLGIVQISGNATVNGAISDFKNEPPKVAIPKIPFAPPTVPDQSTPPFRLPPPPPPRPPAPPPPPPPPFRPNSCRTEMYPDDVQARDYRLPPPSVDTDLLLIDLHQQRLDSIALLNVGGDFRINTQSLSLFRSAFPSVEKVIRLFVDSPNGETIRIASNSRYSKRPVNLQIYYDGTSPIEIEHEFTGVIYAPHAHVMLAGNSTMYGAIIAGEVTCSANSAMFFDLDLLGKTL